MDKYGLIGYPLKHSFSSRFFNEKFKNELICAQYDNYELSDIKDIIPILMSKPELRGLNITIPYKEAIVPLLNEIDPLAKKIGAVNVIKIHNFNGELFLKGYNTDIVGFRDSINQMINPSIHQKALILGTGGASKAVFYGLQELGITSKFVSRCESSNNLVYEDLNKLVFEEYQIIVNASPVGTYPNVDQYPKIPYNYLSKNHLLYDLVYNPALTRFLAKGKEYGAKIKNGYQMLELQALAAWEIWNEN